MSKAKKPKTPLDCGSLVYYDRKYGDLIWKKRRAMFFNETYAGMSAIRQNSKGEYIIKARGVEFSARRVAWALLKRKNSDGVIYVRDGNKANLKPDNLTDISPALRRRETKYDNVFIGEKGGYDVRLSDRWIKGVEDIRKAATMAATGITDVSGIFSRLLAYDAATGALTWLPRGQSTFDTRFAGKPAGRLNKEGYLYMKIHGVEYSAAKIAWSFVYGEFPGHRVYLIDGDPLNLSASNLSEEQPKYGKRATKYVGVIRTNKSDKYEARITIHGNLKSFCGFDTPEAAHDFRVAKIKEIDRLEDGDGGM